MANSQSTVSSVSAGTSSSGASSIGSRLSADKGFGTTVDTAKELSFTYDGVTYQGVQGDTLASALIANGVQLVGRSFKYHRPRGIFTAGSEEPNALVQLGEGNRTEPNTRATQVELFDGLVANSQNCFPSVKYDVGAINSLVSRFLPAGFYYKTFMWPASMWMTYEKFIRRAAGLGKSPTENDPDNYEQLNAHCEVLVVGAGPSGLAAALAAAGGGQRVILMDEHSEAGGSLLWNNASVNDRPAMAWVRETVAQLEALSNVQIVRRCTVSSYLDHNFITAAERISDHLPLSEQKNAPVRHRFWKIRAGRVVVAAGSIERPLLFADNDRPGVMLSAAVRCYINRYAVLPAKEMVVFTNNDSAYATALDAARAGAKVVVVDLRAAEQIKGGAMASLLNDAGIELLTGTAITAVQGGRGVRSVTVQPLGSDKRSLSGSSREIPCQVVAVSGGWNPTVHLHSQARGKLDFKDDVQAFVPRKQAVDDISLMNPHFMAGACNGVFDLEECLAEGHSIGLQAEASLSSESAGSGVLPEQSSNSLRAVMAAGDGLSRDIEALWTVPTDHEVGKGARKHFHDLQNDVTVADIHLAAREGYQSVEHLKRYTTTGMGTDQGKTSNVNALAVMAELRGAAIPDVGTTTFRPPYTPVTFGAVAGQYTGNLFLQERTTAMQPWHLANGAVFEDVGDWKRPWYFPRGEESMHEAVQRECRMVRESVGMVDASTLGKIDIQGEDAAEFLNMIYTNAWLKLAVGKCRYGLMLNEHGMVFDDGVTTCIGPNHYHMTTTTGGAARVMNWLEEWLQTEWPDKRVYCTSVTEQWAVAALNGPNARALLAKLTDMPLDDDSFGHMSFAEAQVAGVPARIFRISFTGELSYEINVPARYGLHLWEALVAAGDEFDICVYGTEAMHVLRAEKGFVIVGQDTDGTVTPGDLGMNWIMNNTKPDFLGKRSLSRTDTARTDRRQLVGILTEDPQFVLPEGAHLVGELLERPPMPTEGHITSSYFSPNVGRSIAMALVTSGLSRKGEKVNAKLMDGRTVPATIVDPVFVDPEGVRLNA